LAGIWILTKLYVWQKLILADISLVTKTMLSLKI